MSEKPKGLPLAGQGKPLPFDFPYKGQWLLEGRVFLYRPENQTSLGGPEMTVILNDNSDDWCLGFNSMQLAFALRVGSEQIFAHNSARTLFLVRTDDVPPPSPSGLKAKRYIFQIEDRQAPVTIELGIPGGRA